MTRRSVNSTPQCDDLAPTTPSSARRSEITLGWKTVAPACAAVAPLGLALGMLVTKSGLDWWWATALAAIVFAGSMEFLLVGLLLAVAPLAQVAISTLLVNFRHVFYALSFPLHRVNGPAWKAYSTFALTDEVYAVAATPESANWSRAKIISIQTIFHAIWIMCVTAGAALGTLIPPEIIGLEFAVTALFVVLTLEAYKARRSIPIPALALVCAAVGMLISAQHMLLISMSLFVAALTATYFYLGRRRSPQRGNDA